MQEFWKKKGKELGFLTDTEWDGWLQGRVDVAWFIKIRKREEEFLDKARKNTKEFKEVLDKIDANQ